MISDLLMVFPSVAELSAERAYNPRLSRARTHTRAHP